MENDIKQWEVWYGDFPFEEDNNTSKARPIIVVDSTSIMILSVKVTSTDHSITDDYDVPIMYWKEAGLDHSSIASVSKIMEVRNDAFLYKIGDLHPDDIYAIETTIIEYFEKMENT